MGILKIQLQAIPVSLPYNKENHEMLAPICKKLAKDFAVLKVYLHHNNVYIQANTTDVAELANMCIELGYSFARAFKKNPGVMAQAITDVSRWEAIHEFEQEAAKMLYEEYVEEQASETTLFGKEGIIPFESLPEFFRNGVEFDGSAIDDAVQAAKKASKQMADLFAMYSAIFSPPPSAPPLVPPTITTGVNYP